MEWSELPLIRSRLVSLFGSLGKRYLSIGVLGTTLRASSELLTFLDLFRTPSTIESICQEYQIPDLEGKLSFLMEHQILFSPEHDELKTWWDCFSGGMTVNRETQHFVIFGNDQDLPDLVELCESVFVKLQKQLPYPSQQKIMLCLCQTSAMFKKLSGKRHLPTWLSFFVLNTRILVIHLSNLRTFPLTKDALEQSLLHELTHVFLRQSGILLPIWLEEGLCEYFSQGYDDEAFKALLTAKPMIPFEILEKEGLSNLLEWEDTPIRENMAYRQSHSFVQFVISRYGVNLLKDWIFNLKLGQNYRNSFEQYYPQSLETTEEHWRQSISL